MGPMRLHGVSELRQLDASTGRSGPPLGRRRSLPPSGHGRIAAIVRQNEETVRRWLRHLQSATSRDSRSAAAPVRQASATHGRRSPEPAAHASGPFPRPPHTLRRWAQHSCSLAPPASATMSHRERIARRSAGNRTTSNVSKRSMTMRAAFQACCTGTELRLPPREQRPTPRPSVPLTQGRAAGLAMSRGSGK
jgi:hypothetical protein